MRYCASSCIYRYRYATSSHDFCHDLAIQASLLALAVPKVNVPVGLILLVVIGVLLVFLLLFGPDFPFFFGMDV